MVQPGGKLQKLEQAFLNGNGTMVGLSIDGTNLAAFSKNAHLVFQPCNFIESLMNAPNFESF